MSVIFKSINPVNGRIYRTFETIANNQLDKCVESSYARFRHKYHIGVHAKLERRFEKMTKLSQILHENRQEYANLITLEMGKPIV